MIENHGNTSSESNGIRVSDLSDYLDAVDGIWRWVEENSRENISCIREHRESYRVLKEELSELLSEYGKPPVVNCVLLGASSCGKSEFINSFLGAEVAPSDHLMSTTLGLTKFRHGEKEGIINEERQEPIDKEQYSRDIQDQSLTGLHYLVDHPEVPKDMVLVDTPGFDGLEYGEMKEKEEKLQDEAIELADIFLLMINIDQGTLPQNYLKFIQDRGIKDRIKSSGKKLYIILTCADYKEKKGRYSVEKQIRMICVENGIPLENCFSYCSKREPLQIEEKQQFNRVEKELRQNLRDDCSRFCRTKKTMNTLLPWKNPVVHRIRSFNRKFCESVLAMEKRIENNYTEARNVIDRAVFAMAACYKDICFRKILNADNDEIVQREWNFCTYDKVCVRFEMKKLNDEEKSTLKNALSGINEFKSFRYFSDDTKIYDMFSSVVEEIIKKYEPKPNPKEFWFHTDSEKEQRILLQRIKFELKSPFQSFSVKIMAALNNEIGEKKQELFNRENNLLNSWNPIKNKYIETIQETGLCQPQNYP